MATREKKVPPHSPEEKKALGRRLAAARQEAGFTLDTAAKALTDTGHQIGRGAIGAREVGRNVPDAIWAKRLAKLYGCGLEAMVLDEENGSGSWPLSGVIEPSEWARVPAEIKADVMQAVAIFVARYREQHGSDSGKSNDSRRAA